MENMHKKGIVMTPDADKKIIAIIYDFDKTLTPRPMREYISWPELSPRESQALWDDNQSAHSDEEEDKAGKKGVRLNLVRPGVCSLSI